MKVIRTIKRKCEECGTVFYAPRSEVKRGYGRFCSQSCSSVAAARRRKPKPNCKCFLCGTAFYRSPSKVRASRSGLVFCSRKCKDEAQRISTGIEVLWPSHYGEKALNHRGVAFRAHPHQCNRCGYKKCPEVLEVHHKDRNRSNNDSTNLELLCPTCHAEEHFLAQEGRWSKSPAKQKSKGKTPPWKYPRRKNT